MSRAEHAKKRLRAAAVDMVQITSLQEWCKISLDNKILAQQWRHSLLLSVCYGTVAASTIIIAVQFF